MSQAYPTLLNASVELADADLTIRLDCSLWTDIGVLQHFDNVDSTTEHLFECGIRA